jgi:hypothetical protein
MSTYSQLRQIIPPDQALASKALQAGLQQVKNIFDTELPQLAVATEGLESNVGLDDISNLTEPLPANVIAYYANTLATGSGPQGLLLLTDVIGSIAGYNITGEISNTANILGNMTASGELNLLINSTTGVYTVMENCIAGVYTQYANVVNPDPPPATLDEYTVIIPGGLPGAGTYGPFGTANAAIGNAFTSGLNPAMISAVGNIVAAYPTNVANTTANVNIICGQLQTQNTNLALSGVDFANLVPGLQPWSLVYNLASTGLEVVEGGPAYVLQSIANVDTQGGQAIVSTMREARNQERLSIAGMQTDITISDQYPEPEADLGTTQYTVAQATSQKII